MGLQALLQALQSPGVTGAPLSPGGPSMDWMTGMGGGDWMNQTPNLPVMPAPAGPAAKDPVAEAMKAQAIVTKAQADARQKLMDALARHQAQKVEIQRPKFGTRDLLAGLLPTLVLSALNKDAGAAFASGYMGGKDKDAETRTQQGQLDAQAAEQDYQRKLAMLKTGLDFTNEDVGKADSDLAQAKRDAENAKREDQGLANTRAQNSLRIAASIAQPSKPEEVGAWAAQVAPLYSAAAKVPGYEGFAALVPTPERVAQMKQDLQLAIDAQTSAQAKKDRDAAAKSLEAQAVAATDAFTKVGAYSRLAALYSQDDPERSKMYRQYAEHWQNNPTPQEENKQYQRGRDAAGDQRSQIDKEIEYVGQIMKEIADRAKAGTMTPEDEAAWKDAQERQRILIGQRAAIASGMAPPANPFNGSIGSGNYSVTGSGGALPAMPAPRPAKTEAQKKAEAAKESEWGKVRDKAVALKAKIAAGNFDPAKAETAETAQKELNFYLDRMDSIKPGSTGRAKLAAPDGTPVVGSDGLADLAALKKAYDSGVHKLPDPSDPNSAEAYKRYKQIRDKWKEITSKYKLTDIVEAIGAIRAMPEGPAKQSAIQNFQKETGVRFSAR